MTLILTTVWHNGVSQVADRQLSREVRPGQIEPFDPVANKTVLFAARDAFVSISFAGTAYIDGDPTDEWIAASVCWRAYSELRRKESGWDDRRRILPLNA